MRKVGLHTPVKLVGQGILSLGMVCRARSARYDKPLNFIILMNFKLA